MSEPHEPRSSDDGPLDWQPPTGPSPDDAPATQPMTRREAREAARSRPQTAATVVLGAAAVPTSASSDAPAGTRAAAKAARASTGGGLGAVIARHPNAWLFSALAIVFMLLAVGAVYAGTTVSTEQPAALAAAPSPSPTVDPPRPMPATIADGARLRTCMLSSVVTDSRLGTFEGSVINAKTGQALFNRSATKPAPPASVMKTLIAATALKVLGADYRFSTKVYAGSAEGSVVLVGGGDPTLSAGGGSVYAGAPQMSDLAAQVRGAYDQPITDVILDATMWGSSDAWDPTWPESERTLGFQPLIVPLMVDGDRANPRAQDSFRSTDPVKRAGEAFAAALGDGPVEFSRGSAITSNTLLGEVKSQPVSTLIGQMLPVSDNTLAEMLARVSSKVSGRDGSAASLTSLVTSALAGYGIEATNLVIKDGSGESNKNGVPPLVVAKLMAKAFAGSDGLGVIYKSLPVSGKSGTLSNRFTGPNAVARGAVHAKTGSIASSYTLGGIVHAADGTDLAFAFYALGNVRASARPALDTVATGVFNCGDNISNH